MDPPPMRTVDMTNPPSFPHSPLAMPPITTTAGDTQPSLAVTVDSTSSSSPGTPVSPAKTATQITIVPYVPRIIVPATAPSLEDLLRQTRQPLTSFSAPSANIDQALTRRLDTLEVLLNAERKDNLALRDHIESQQIAQHAFNQRLLDHIRGLPTAASPGARTAGEESKKVQDELSEVKQEVSRLRVEREEHVFFRQRVRDLDGRLDEATQRIEQLSAENASLRIRLEKFGEGADMSEAHLDQRLSSALLSMDKKSKSAVETISRKEALAPDLILSSKEEFAHFVATHEARVDKKAKALRAEFYSAHNTIQQKMGSVRQVGDEALANVNKAQSDGVAAVKKAEKDAVDRAKKLQPVAPVPVDAKLKDELLGLVNTIRKESATAQSTVVRGINSIAKLRDETLAGIKKAHAATAPVGQATTDLTGHLSTIRKELAAMQSTVDKGVSSIVKVRDETLAVLKKARTSAQSMENAKAAILGHVKSIRGEISGAQSMLDKGVNSIIRLRDETLSSIKAAQNAQGLDGAKAVFEQYEERLKHIISTQQTQSADSLTAALKSTKARMDSLEEMIRNLNGADTANIDRHERGATTWANCTAAIAAFAALGFEDDDDNDNSSYNAWYDDPPSEYGKDREDALETRENLWKKEWPVYWEGASPEGLGRDRDERNG